MGTFRDRSPSWQKAGDPHLNVAITGSMYPHPLKLKMQKLRSSRSDAPKHISPEFPKGVCGNQGKCHPEIFMPGLFPLPEGSPSPEGHGIFIAF
jgi:hypothetical protein